MIVCLSALERLASVRPPGLMEDWIDNGSVAGDVIVMDDGDYLRLLAKYRPGYGDLLARLLKPIAKAMHLENCQGCESRQQAINAMLPTEF